MKALMALAALLTVVTAQAQTETCGRVIRVIGPAESKLEMKFPNDPQTYTIDIAASVDSGIMLATQAIASSDKVQFCLLDVRRQRGAVIRSMGPFSLRSID